jgi:hypothetical protein
LRDFLVQLLAVAAEQLHSPIRRTIFTKILQLLRRDAQFAQGFDQIDLRDLPRVKGTIAAVFSTRDRAKQTHVAIVANRKM